MFQVVLAQAKDDALQKSFVQIEEMNILRSERDELLRRIEHINLVGGGGGGGGEEEFLQKRKTDSGFLSVGRIKVEVCFLKGKSLKMSKN